MHRLAAQPERLKQSPAQMLLLQRSHQCCLLCSPALPLHHQRKTALKAQLLDLAKVQEDIQDEASAPLRSISNLESFA